MPIADELVRLLEDRDMQADEAAVLQKLDVMIDRFSSYMASLPNPIAASPLTNPEKALLRTFLVATFREKI